MTQTGNATTATTSTVRALVTLTVAPKEGQSTTAAAEAMLELFREYITSREHPFLDDYGTTPEELAAYRADPDEEQPTWGGYEGPFVLEATVQSVAPVDSEEE